MDPPYSPGSQLALHLVAVLGSIHFALAVVLLLSVGMEPKSRASVSIGAFVALALHIAAVFRIPAYVGIKVVPVSMPMMPLLIGITITICAVMCEQDVDNDIARSANLTAERKEFKGNTMENRAYDKRVKQAMAEKGYTDGLFSSGEADAKTKSQ